MLQTPTAVSVLSALVGNEANLINMDAITAVRMATSGMMGHVAHRRYPEKLLFDISYYCSHCPVLCRAHLT